MRRRGALTDPSSRPNLLYIQHVRLVELQQHDGLEQADPDLVLAGPEPCRERDRRELVSPAEFPVLVLGCIPAREGVDRRLKLGCQVESPAFFQLRIPADTSPSAFFSTVCVLVRERHDK